MDFLSDEDARDLLDIFDEPSQVGSMSEYFNFFNSSSIIQEDENDDPIADDDEDDLINEFDVVANEDLGDSGQTHPDWLEITSNMKSGDHYRERILHFLKWKKNTSDPQIPLLESVNNYFKYYHAQTKVVDLETVNQLLQSAHDNI